MRDRAFHLSGSRVSDAGRHLIALIRRVQFGTVYALPVAGGQPVLDPIPRVVQETKFGSEFKQARPRPIEPLHNEDHQLLAALAAIGDGVIESIEVRHGLPFHMTRVLEGMP